MVSPEPVSEVRKMLNIEKYYVLDEKKKAIAVQIPIKDFERLESVIEDYGLAQLMDETEDDERLSGDDALTYYRSLVHELDN
jgi:hypothetical protein